MNARRLGAAVLAASVALALPAGAWAQFPSDTVGFNGPPIDDPATSQEMFRQPAFSGTTAGYILANSSGLYNYNAAYRAASGFQTEGDAALDVYVNWVDVTNPESWLRLTTFDGPVRPNPSLNTEGKVRFKLVNRGDLSSGAIGVCIGIRETGVDTGQLGNGGTTGTIEWAGVSTSLSVVDCGTNGCQTTVAGDDLVTTNGERAWINWGPNRVLNSLPVSGDDVAYSGYTVAASGGRVPVPAITLPISPFAASLEWNLATGQVKIDGVPQGGGIAGFTGDGNLSAANDRGTLEQIAIVPADGELSPYVLFNIDELQFEAVIPDPLLAPSIQAPVYDTDTQVRVNCIAAATVATLYINGASPVNANNVGGVATFNGLNLDIGDVLTATQTAYAEISPLSAPVVVYAEGTALAEGFDGFATQADLEQLWTQTAPANALKPLLASGSASSCDNFVNIDYVTAPSVSKLYRSIGTLNGTDAEPLVFTWRFKHDVNNANARARIELSGSTTSGTEGATGFAFTNGLAGAYGTEYCILLKTSDPQTNNANGFLPDYFAYNYATTGVTRVPQVWHKMQVVVKSTTLDYYVDDVLVNPAAFPGGVPRPTTTPYQYVVLGLGYSNNGPAEMYDDISVTVGNAPLPFGDPNAVFSPTTAAPIFPADTTVDVEDINSNASAVTVYVDGALAGSSAGPFPTGTTSITVPALNNGEAVAATQTLSGVESCLSAAVIVAVPAPALVPPLVPGQTLVRVSGLEESLADAVTVYRYLGEGDMELLGTLVDPAADPATVTTLPLTNGESIVATQTIGGVEGPLSAQVTVAVPAPTLPGPLNVGDTQVTVADVHLLATQVTVFVNAASYTAPAGGVTSVNVTVPLLTVNDLVKARQTIDGVESPDSNSILVVKPLCLLAYSDDFDGGSSAGNWTLRTSSADYIADFAFDYSTRSIPPAPNSVGTTVGLYMTVNKNDAVPSTDAVNAFPIGQSFSGDYSLLFDMWMNYNGGSGGGVGSTEFTICGLNASGNQVIWPNNTASDGFTFCVTGEGGAARDYRAYIGATEQTVASGTYVANNQDAGAAFYQALFPSPPFETPGVPGKQWVECEISRINGVTEWRINGVKIAGHTSTTYTSGNIMMGYMDIFTSIANPAADNFIVYDNVRVYRERPAGPQGDWDNNGAVNLVDYTAFEDCFNGPGILPDPANGSCRNICLVGFDYDADDDIDLRDFAQFARAVTN